VCAFMCFGGGFGERSKGRVGCYDLKASSLLLDSLKMSYCIFSPGLLKTHMMLNRFNLGFYSHINIDQHMEPVKYSHKILHS